MDAGLKTRAIGAACAASKLYLQRFPGALGKRYLWDNLVLPYLAWRPIEVEARAAFGGRFLGSFPDLIHSYLYFFGIWEPAVTAYYDRTLKEGDVVIDIGANVGAHALLASRLVGASGRVHAIEASPTIFQSLVRNIAMNKADNIRTYNAAVTDQVGQTPVFMSSATNIGRTTIVPDEAKGRGATEETTVEGRPLHLIVPEGELLAARLIKIDVEGAEWLVVSGMMHLIPRLHAQAEILIEVSPKALTAAGASLRTLIDVFAQAGFEPFEITNKYGVDDYISPPENHLVPFKERDFALADLVFRRHIKQGE